MKRLKKKIIKKKRRKNPVDDKLIELLSYNIIHPDLEYFSRTLNYYYQGGRCDDCGYYYDECECEYCENCYYRRCICELRDKLVGKQGDDFGNEIRKYIIKFAKKILTQKQLEHLKNLISFNQGDKRLLKYFN